MPNRFRLGSLSARAAWITVVLLLLAGMPYLHAIPLLIYAVPCAADYRKQPATFWKPFTLVSIAGAILVTSICVFGIRRQIDGHELTGFPLPNDAVVVPGYIPARLLNLVLVSGLCLLPLAAWSTIDTCRHGRAAALGAFGALPAYRRLACLWHGRRTTERQERR